MLLNVQLMVYDQIVSAAEKSDIYPDFKLLTTWPSCCATIDIRILI
ncbi:MAG: hypothetical protein HXS48_02255 [Theionarchaea archaeon]|nr:hypothetical protein [Theionarchaea archaeon]